MKEIFYFHSINKMYPSFEKGYQQQLSNGNFLEIKTGKILNVRNICIHSDTVLTN